MDIREIMSQPVITCPESGTLDEAARLMWDHDCGIVAVVDDAGRLSGVVTDRDICMAAFTQGRTIGSIPTGVAMARQAIAVHADELVSHAEELMADNQVRRLPVIDDDGRPVGMVSVNDLARLVAPDDAGNGGLVATLAAISEPRRATVAAPKRAVPVTVGM